MKKRSRDSAIDSEAALAEARRAARDLQVDAEGTVVTLEDGEPCLKSPADGVPWDWDMEAVAPPARCQECGSREKAFREPDGRILCENCLLHGSSP
jgi:hypothetical protein